MRGGVRGSEFLLSSRRDLFPPARSSRFAETMLFRANANHTRVTPKVHRSLTTTAGPGPGNRHRAVPSEREARPVTVQRRADKGASFGRRRGRRRRLYGTPPPQAGLRSSWIFNRPSVLDAAGGPPPLDYQQSFSELRPGRASEGFGSLLRLASTAASVRSYNTVSITSAISSS